MSAPYGPATLVSLADVKNHLNIPISDTSQDTELQGFLDAASVYITNKVGPIVPTQFVEVHSGGGPTIVLDNPPVMQVDSVIEYVGPTAYTLTAFTLGGSAGAYAYSLDDPRSGIIARRFTGGIAGRFVAGYRNVQVTYWGGQSAVPADVRMAVLQDAAGMYGGSQLPPAPGWEQGQGDLPLNPMNMFPRVAAILSAPSLRAPTIA